MTYAENCISLRNENNLWTCAEDGEECTPEREDECAQQYGEFQFEGMRESYD